MQILINDKNEITSYATVGSIDGGIEVEIPAEVIEDNPLSYRYENRNFIKNPDWEEPAVPLTELEELQLAVAELAEFVAGGAE